MSTDSSDDPGGESDAGTGSTADPGAGTPGNSDAETTPADAGIDTGRFGRTLALIGFVTAVFVLLTANRLGGRTAQIGLVAIGTIAFITAVVGFFIAAGSAFDA